jgi:signal transduction histidine kinase
MANARTISEEKTGPLRNQYAGYAEDIAQAAEHLLALIDDASDLEAVDGAHFRYSEEDVDLCDVARRAAGLLRVKAQSRDITIDIPPPEEHLICRAEFRRALQIVLNLLSNAIRYGPKDAMIWIRAEAAGDMARLTVSDMGKGISADEQQVIFDKFERLGRSGDGGSGLGLYISKKLAVAMGGNILIDSAPGKGVRISLELPLKKGASA